MPLIVAGVALLAVLALSARSAREPAAPRSEPRVARMTNLGTIRLASVSPDGRRLAYVRSDGMRESLWLRNSDGTSHLQLVPPVDGTFRSLTFAPGEFIYYTLFLPDRTHIALYRVSTRGGSPRVVLDASGRISFSPDGSRFAYTSTTSLGVAESQVVIASIDGASTRVLALRKPPASFIKAKPSWSSDGSQLTVVTTTADVSGTHQLVTIDAADGTERSHTTLRLAMVDDLVGLPDGSHVVSAREQNALPLRLWQVAPLSSALRPLTNDVSDYTLAGVMPDGRLVAVRSERARALWVGDPGERQPARQVASDSGSLDEIEGVAWTPEGLILYPASESGNVDIWALDPATGVRRRLTSHPAAEFHPSVSADGRTIAFASDREGATSVWIMSSDGGNLRRLTNGADTRPAISPDGRWVIVQRLSVDNIPVMLWRVRLDSGEAVRVGPSESIRPAVSPDGRFIAHYWMMPEQWTLAVTPADGGLPVRTLPIRSTHSGRVVRWSPDGTGLAFIDAVHGTSNIWLQPLSDAPARALTHLAGARIAAFDWSRDGSRLAWTTITEVRDVVTVEPDMVLPRRSSLN